MLLCLLCTPKMLPSHTSKSRVSEAMLLLVISLYKFSKKSASIYPLNGKFYHSNGIFMSSHYVFSLFNRTFFSFFCANQLSSNCDLMYAQINTHIIHKNKISSTTIPPTRIRRNFAYLINNKSATIPAAMRAYILL